MRPQPGPFPQEIVSTGSRAGLHTKAMVFDRKDVFVGSFNLDPRSSLINTEAGLYVESPELAAMVAQYMDEGVKPDRSYRVLLAAEQLDGARGSGPSAEGQVLYACRHERAQARHERVGCAGHTNSEHARVDHGTGAIEVALDHHRVLDGRKVIAREAEPVEYEAGRGRGRGRRPSRPARAARRPSSSAEGGPDAARRGSSSPRLGARRRLQALARSAGAPSQSVLGREQQGGARRSRPGRRPGAASPAPSRPGRWASPGAARSAR